MFTRKLTTRIVSVTLVAALISPAFAGAQEPVRFSVVGGLSLPIGDLANSTNLGLNLGLRGEGPRHGSGWSFRGDVNYDQYNGRGTVDRYSYMGLAGNLVHRGGTGPFYQFGGLGLYNSKVAFTNNLNSTDTNLGVQMGLGFDMTTDRRVFSEFGMTSAFTSGRSSVWFPVRVGFRF